MGSCRRVATDHSEPLGITTNDCAGISKDSNFPKEQLDVSKTFPALDRPQPRPGSPPAELYLA